VSPLFFRSISLVWFPSQDFFFSHVGSAFLCITHALDHSLPVAPFYMFKPEPSHPYKKTYVPFRSISLFSYLYLPSTPLPVSKYNFSDLSYLFRLLIARVVRLFLHCMSGRRFGAIPVLKHRQSVSVQRYLILPRRAFLAPSSYPSPGFDYSEMRLNSLFPSPIHCVDHSRRFNPRIPEIIYAPCLPVLI